ncbi:CinA family nicotinamide mononucleotide deamidase-related protein [Photobacterium atrarenae]|uniref:CinA-like protein n=1 Tax=Photobacterium atrarenae TaxID=865757 RepID=A0ABY5GK02_9GAMM|nr:CinA family nicotinamide mononucleotide deamidase-related protein [Photobacterium atrarenae]UTV28663.1 CinA family nicotinamide mononucleotide deamidase-related protein [Photobacterium atrarenae]
MISTGEEVLHGDIVDTNAAWLSRLFFQHGFPLSRRTTVGDQLSDLASEIEHCSLTADIVVVNGGLGPTTDDLTAQAAAIAADSGLEQSDHWVAQMQAKYQAMGREMPAANLKQAMLPEGAVLLDNPVGTACGFAMKLNRAWLYFTPGVPSEFKQMVTDEILPRLKQQFSEVAALDCHRFYTFGLSESGIGQTLAAIKLPEGYQLGYRSSLPFIEVKLFTPRHARQAREVQQQLVACLGEHVVSVDREMVAHVGQQLQSAGLDVMVVEHCSGGWLTNWLSGDPLCRQALRSGQTRMVDTGEQDRTLAAMLAYATEERAQSGASITLISGAWGESGFQVGLVTPTGCWGQVVLTRREYSNQAQRNIVATVILDMLRRYLAGQAVIGQYEFLSCAEQLHLPAEALCGD